jgi:hypothetical protein
MLLLKQGKAVRAMVRHEDERPVWNVVADLYCHVLNLFRVSCFGFRDSNLPFSAEIFWGSSNR